MGMSSCAVLIFQKVLLFLCRVLCGEVFVYSRPAAGDATATPGEHMVYLVLRDEFFRRRHFCQSSTECALHVGKLPQFSCCFLRLVIVEKEQSFVFRVVLGEP